MISHKTNLIIGTGKAWAWHNRAKLCPISFTNVKLLDSPENVGAFAPTGSTSNIEMDFIWHEINKALCWEAGIEIHFYSSYRNLLLMKQNIFVLLTTL